MVHIIDKRPLIAVVKENFHKTASTREGWMFLFDNFANTPYRVFAMAYFVSDFEV